MAIHWGLILAALQISFGIVNCQCPEKNGLFAIQHYCDRYVECRNGSVREAWCPDGLVFDDRRSHFRYPCDYPSDVDCANRPELQPAQPSPNCPRRWGYFADGDPLKCGVFWNCVDGRSFQYNCPEGLAFSVTTSRCEYPDEAPNCDAETFLGFGCPPVDPLILRIFLGNPRFAHPKDCKKFYTCIEGKKPRLQSCPHGMVFNSISGICDDPEAVSGCEHYYGESRKEKKKV